MSNINEMFIEGRPADISSEFSSLITFMIDDVKEFGSRSTSRSLTIIMPGTKKNNDIFGNIFEINSANRYSSNLANVGYNYNPAISASVVIFQDRVQVFKGILRLIEIVIDKGSIEYEVNVLGELGGFIFALGNKKLEELDFSQYNTTLTGFSIFNSWDNEGSGVYFPLMDYGGYSTGEYGQAKHDWQIQTFRPALFVKEYIDKIFAGTKYKYNCPLFNTYRFKRLIVPHNKKSLTKKSSNLVLASGGPFSGNSNAFDPATGDRHIHNLFFNSQTMTSFEVYSDGFSTIGYKYIGSTNLYMNLKLDYNGQLESDAGITFMITTFGDNLPTIERTAGDIGATSGVVPISGSANFGLQVTPGMIIIFQVLELNSGSAYYTSIQNLNYSLTISSQGVAFVDINPGDPIPINDTIPSNVLQKDFVIDIIKLFNLYVIEDKYEPNLLRISPFIDFYSGQIVDWSGKLNRAAPVRQKPLYEMNSRYYSFKFKQDGDFYNDEYRKRYNLGYGDYIHDSEFEFSNESSDVALNFSATPLIGYPGEDKVYSTVFKMSGAKEESTDFNIRILQSKKVTGVNSWNLMSGATVIAGVTGYGYAGHLDDPDAPGNDLNFGVPKQLYFQLVAGSLQVNQFNVYYSAYLAEINDKDSRMLTGNFRLTPQDIQELDFSKFIYLDGSLFRLNKVEDYNATKEDSCKCELLKVINTIY